jgi:hypothetical protein
MISNIFQLKSSEEPSDHQSARQAANPQYQLTAKIFRSNPTTGIELIDGKTILMLIVVQIRLCPQK